MFRTVVRALAGIPLTLFTLVGVILILAGSGFLWVGQKIIDFLEV